MNNKSILAILLVLAAIGAVVAISGCTTQETPTVAAKPQLTEDQYVALVGTVADQMDAATTRIVNAHDDYLLYADSSDAVAEFSGAKATCVEQKAKLDSITPPAGYESINAKLVSAIDKEIQVCDLCINWVNNGNSDSESQAETLMMSAMSDVDDATQMLDAKL